MIRVLSAWSHRDGRPALLIIDGLDQARGADVREPFLKLMERISTHSDWNIAASIRRWDLRQLDGTQDEIVLRAISNTARGDIPEPYRSPEFDRLRTFCIPLLTEPELQLAISAGPPALRSALEIPAINQLAR